MFFSFVINKIWVLSKMPIQRAKWRLRIYITSNSIL